MNSRSCLVLGGGGFIGRHLIRKLLAARWRVRVLDVNRPERPEPGVEYRIASFKDAEAARAALEGVHTCFHLVSATLPASSNQNIIFDLDANLRDTVLFLQTCAALGLPRIVYLSSGGTVYGSGHDRPIPESATLQPICAYGVTKASVELYLNLFRHLNGLDYRIARLANPYGPGQPSTMGQGAVSVFMDKIAKGEPIEIWGDGSITRDYLFVEDAAEAIAALGARVHPSSDMRVFNVGSGRGVRLIDLISAIEVATERKALAHFKPSRGFDVPVNILDCSAIEKAIGWRANTPLDAGLKKTWDAYRSECV